MGHELEEFRVEEKAKRAGMLAWTLAPITGPCDVEGAGEARVGFEMLIGTTGICESDSHMSLPEVREMTSFGDRNLFQKFMRNAGFFYLPEIEVFLAVLSSFI